MKNIIDADVKTRKLTLGLGDYEYRISVKPGGTGIASNSLYLDNTKVTENGYVIGIGGKNNVVRYLGLTQDQAQWLSQTITEFRNSVRSNGTFEVKETLESLELRVQKDTERLRLSTQALEEFKTRRVQELLNKKQQLLAELKEIEDYEDCENNK